MERGGNPYCSEEREFSLPEGVDLVGADNSRKSTTPYQQQQQQPRRRNNPPTWKAAAKLAVINMFVCALVLGYALFGSFVFLALENNRQMGSSVLASTSGYTVGRKGTNLTTAILNSLQTEQIQQLKSETVKNIWDITLSMNILYPDNWTKMTNEEVGHFQRTLLEKVILAVENVTVQDVPYPWTFPRAFLFALTTLTTIGYGGIGPKTSSGKLATMVYAVFGIPIMLWYLSNVGSLLARIARFLCAKVCCCCCCKEGPSSSASSTSSSTASTRKVSDPYYSSVRPMDGDVMRGKSQEDRLMDDRDAHEEHRISICFILVICLSVLLGYVCMGAYVISRWQEWKILDSFYFCFCLLTTISFGDSRTQRTGRLDEFKHRTEWFCSFYILFGMALTSMFFNILHEEISRKFKRWKHQSPGGGDHPPSHPASSEPKEILQQQVQKGRRPVENSYSVHFMNFSSPSATASRNFTEETILSNEVHRGLATSDCREDEIPPDAYMAHPMPNTREMYSPHPVFPR